MNKRWQIIIAIFIWSSIGMIAFQNCSPNQTKFAETLAPANSETPASGDGPIVDVVNQKQDGSILHVPGTRNFQIVLRGLKITSSTCKLQYLKNGNEWVDLAIDLYCNQDFENTAFSLPAQDNWTNNFISGVNGGVKIRMVKTSDDELVGEFAQKLTCTNKPFASTSTPNVDENCNGKWDDSVQGPMQTCEQDSGALAFNSSFSCAPTLACSGMNATFFQHRWTFATGFYTSSDCHFSSMSTQYSGPNYTLTDTNLSGTSPTHPWVPTNPTNFCDMVEGYEILNPTNRVSGYGYHLASWAVARCVYSYPSYISYN